MASTILRSCALILVTVLPLAACGALSGGADEGPVGVTFVATDWSEGGSSDPVVTEVDASKGDTITVRGAIDDVDVTFTSVSPDEIELETSSQMAPAGKTGGINLNDTRTDFTLAAGSELTFSTPTTDSGTTWVVTIGGEGSPSS